MNRMIKALAIAACAGAALSLGSAAAAESKVTIIKASDALSGMKVARDKETGELRAATAEEIAQIAAAPTRARAKSLAPGVTVLNRPATTMINHPDGSATIRRSFEDLDSLVMTRGADGKLVVHHGATSTSNAAPKE